MAIEEKLNLIARPELLEVINNVADIKNIKDDIIFTIMEQVLNKVAVAKYGSKYNIRTRIYRPNGAIIVERVFSIVDEVEDPNFEIDLEGAKGYREDAIVGEEIVEELPQIDFTRATAQACINLINKQIKEIEKEKEFEAYKDKVGELIVGIVKRIEFDNVVLDLGNNYEGVIKRDHLISYEKFSIGDRVRAVVIDVRQDFKSHQIFLSRAHSSFILKLFTQEIPEIYDGIIEVKGIARDVGSKTKIMVHSDEMGVDPVGVCVGFRGSRIHNILKELKNERVDLIRWSNNFVDLVVNCFKPIKLIKMTVQEENKKLELVVDKENLSVVIGRSGQNVKLISKLLDWHINIITEEEEAEKRQKEVNSKIALLMEVLDVDEVIAHILVLENIGSLNDLVKISEESLSKIEGFSEELAKEIKQRAIVYKEKYDKEREEKIKKYKVQEDLISFDELDLDTKLILAEKGIISLEDLADLSSFDLVDVLGEELISIIKAEKIIMAARSKIMAFAPQE